MKNLFFLFLIFLIGCSSNPVKENTNKSVNTIKINDTSNSLKINKDTIQSIKLFGYKRFLFVKDSIGPVLENTSILKKTFLAQKDNFTIEQIDSAFTIFQLYLEQIKIAPEDDKALYEYNEIKETKIAEYYKKHGVIIESSEGEYYTTPNFTYLTNLFINEVEPLKAKYFNFLIFKNKKVFDDGGLTISWIDLAKRIIETEQHYIELYNTEHENEVFDTYMYYSSVMMYGSENSILSRQKNDSLYELDAVVLNAYDTLINNKNSKSSFIFSEHYDNLNKVHFNPNSNNLIKLKAKYIEAILSIDK